MQGKIVLITGASSGIGAACATRFAQAGARLVLIARRLDRLNQLSEELKAIYKTEAHVLVLDVRDAISVAQKMRDLPTQWQAIDVLINNAGLAIGTDKLQDGNPQEWDTVVDTNLKGLLYITRALVPTMITRKQGHIINIGSIAGHEIYPGGSVYCATKHAVRALNKGLRLDLLGTGIRVSSVDPGMVHTEFSEVRFKGDKERAKSIYQNMKPLTAADIADAVYYCASCPPHVNIEELVIMPTDQASVGHIHRQSES